MYIALIILYLIFILLLASQPLISWLYSLYKTGKKNVIGLDLLIVSAIVLIMGVIALVINSWFLGAFFAVSGQSYFSAKARIRKKEEKKLMEEWELKNLTEDQLRLKRIKNKIDERKHSYKSENWNS